MGTVYQSVFAKGITVSGLEFPTGNHPSQKPLKRIINTKLYSPVFILLIAEAVGGFEFKLF